MYILSKCSYLYLQALPPSQTDDLPAMLSKSAITDTRSPPSAAPPAVAAAAAVHAAITAKKNGAKVPILSHLGGVTSDPANPLIQGVTPGKSLCIPQRDCVTWTVQIPQSFVIGLGGD